jgi:glycine/D-amino acid oxidase-like deaminating enzyme
MTHNAVRSTMSVDSDPYDVVVVGAGASGLCSAIELASDHEVLVLDSGGVGAGASGRAAGFVTLFADWAPFPDAVSYSIERFRWLDGRSEFTFHDRPYVELAESAEEAATLREDHRPLLDRLGYDIEYCSREELASRWPEELDLSGFHGGLVNAESGAINSREYVQALADEARDRGVEIDTHTPVERIRFDDRVVTGVDVASGRIEAETVVVAAGVGTADLVAEFVDVPVRSFVYLNLRVETDASLDPAYPMLYARDVWWRPDTQVPRTLVVSGGMYFLSGRDRPPRNLPTSYLSEVETVLESVAHDVDDVRVVNGSYHTRGTTITPDALPVVDAPASAPDGLVIASGVTGGISMSPFTGAAVRALVTGEEAPTALDPFELDRFDDPPEEFSVHGIRELPAPFRTD